MAAVESQNALYNSQICRLCAEENKFGYSLFTSDEENDFSSLINAYLPLKKRHESVKCSLNCPLKAEIALESGFTSKKIVFCLFRNTLVSDDGKYPKWICPGCHLQVESTVQFFNLVINGQHILQALYNGELQTVVGPQIEEEHEDFAPKAECSGNVFSPEHKMIAQMSILDVQIKRKRGRPRRSESSSAKAEAASVFPDTLPPRQEPDNIVSQSGRYKRRVKLPSRYKEVVRGNELEKIYLEKGIIDKMEPEPLLGQDMLETDMKITSGICPEEVIGHVQGTNGVNLGDLVVVKNRSDKKYGSWKRMTRFMCDICKICFYYEHKFLQHRLSHQNVQFECNECLKTYSDRTSLIEHQTEMDHRGEGIIEAFEGGDMQSEEHLKTNEDLIKDIKSETKTDNNTVVKTEDLQKQVKIEADSEDFIQNKLTDAGEEDKNGDSNEKNSDIADCYKEDDDSSNAKNLKSLKTSRNEARVFICSKCGKTFRNKLLLQRHQSVHSDLRPFTCEFCGSKYKTKQNLLNHAVTHTGEKKYECHICKQQFAYKTSLSLHLRWHKGDKPHVCPDCGKGFTQLGNMQEHMRIHTGERPFECEVCGKKFKTSSQRRMHVKRHQIDRPVKCTMCDKSFVSAEEHKIHIRRHYNIKPYSCNICAKSFIEKCALKKHRRLHTGEKPYTCGECNRGFADRSNLKKHLKMHECKKKALLESQTSKKAKTNVNSSNIIELAISSLDGKSIVEPNSTSMFEPVWSLVEEINVDDEASAGASAAAEMLSTTANDHLICVTFQNPSDGNKTTFIHNVVNNSTSMLKPAAQLTDLSNVPKILDITNVDTSSNIPIFLDNTDILDEISNNTLLKVHSNVNQISDAMYRAAANGATIEFTTNNAQEIDLVDYPD